MLFSLALIIIVGFTLSGIFNRIRIPGIIAMIITGILLGPYVLDCISQDILNISPDLREIALIVLLLKAGLTLDLKDLKKVGRPALLLSFVPATLEILTIVILAPLLFGIPILEAAILGTVIAAVSPAVIVPRMIFLIQHNYGKEKNIPQMILAAASVDDIYVIILFTAFLGMYQGQGFSILSLISVPISIVLGLLLGLICGLFLIWFFKKIHIRDTIKVMIILSVSFLLVTLEDLLTGYIQISGLLAVMSLGITILKFYEILAKRLMSKFSKIWVGAELLLFVLVGAAVNITYFGNTGLSSVFLVISALFFRIIGVSLSLIKTDLNKKEKAFCSVSYIPKATVQAAIGAVPLTMGIPSGNLILTIAVLSVVITAPIGSIGIDRSFKKVFKE